LKKIRIGTDLPLAKKVATDLEAADLDLDLIDLEALDLVDLEALDLDASVALAVALDILEPVGLNVVNEVKDGESNIEFWVSRYQDFNSRVSLQYLLLAFFFGFVAALDRFVAVLATFGAPFVAFLGPFGAVLDRFVASVLDPF